MSLSPDDSSWRTMPLTMRSMRSSWIGRLRSAMRIERASFSRSKGTRRLSDFTTVSSRSWVRSMVVKRWPQLPQKRRRRIALLSSLGRLSFTCVSSWPQKGQRIGRLPRAIHREAGAESLHPGTHSGLGSFIGAVVGTRKPLQHLVDHQADFAELSSAEAARRGRGRAQADTRGYCWFLRVVGDGVLVGRHVC